MRTPKPIAALAEEMPGIYEQLQDVCTTLEERFRDMQDFEFTIEDGRLYMLQTRNGKRTGLAAVRIAVEMHEEGLLDRAAALCKIPADSIDSLLAPMFDRHALGSAEEFARGLPAGPGAASGVIVFTSDAPTGDQARPAGDPMPRRNQPRRLERHVGRARHPHEPRRGLFACGARRATARQGMRLWRYRSVHRLRQRTVSARGMTLREGDAISLDGTLGTVYAGTLATSPSEVRQVLAGEFPAAASRWHRLFETVMAWADCFRNIDVRTNADTPAMVRDALAFGAEGIGLCRTEHMFFEGERIHVMRRMILAANEAERRARARPAAALPARRLQAHLHGHGRPSRHHSPVGPAPARVPAH